MSLASCFVYGLAISVIFIIATIGEEYARFKFVRKSQSDHRTEENTWSRIFVSMTNFLLIAIPAKMMAGLAGSKSQGN